MTRLAAITLCIFYVLVTFIFVEVSAIGTLAAIILLLLLLLSLIEIRVTLAILPILFAISPEIKIGGIPLKLEDFVIPILLIVVIMKILLLKKEIYWSPLFLPIGAILLVNFSTTLWWLSQSSYLDPATSFFRNLKIIEYVSIFFIVTNTLHSQKEAEKFLWYLLLGGLAGGIYGTIQHFIQLNSPVTGPQGEDYNTFAGFLLFYIAIALSVFAKAVQPKEKWLAGLVLCLTFFPFIYSFSRTSYIALVIMLLYLGMRHTKTAFLILGIIVFGFFFLFPQALVERITSIGHILGAASEIPPAFMVRLDTWKWIYEWILVKEPLMGGGIGSVALTVDSEFLRILAETGLVGLICFLWFIRSIIATAKKVKEQFANQITPQIIMVLPAAITAIIIAYFVHSLGSTTFTTIRTMEPFWFLIGILAVLFKIYNERKENKQVGKGESLTSA